MKRDRVVIPYHSTITDPKCLQTAKQSDDHSKLAMFEYLRQFDRQVVYFENSGYPVYNSQVVSQLQLGTILKKVEVFYHSVVKLVLTNHENEEITIDVSLDGKKVTGCSYVPTVYRDPLLSTPFSCIRTLLGLDIDWNNVFIGGRVVNDRH